MSDKRGTEKPEDAYPCKEKIFDLWAENKMLSDKQLLTLSTLAIGFLVVFYESVTTYWLLALFCLPAIFFITTIFLVLSIFKENAELMVSIYEDRDYTAQVQSDLLHKKTQKADATFKLGVIFTLIFALVLIVTNIERNGEMSERTKIEKKSLSGAQNFIKPVSSKPVSPKPEGQSSYTQKPAKKEDKR